MLKKWLLAFVFAGLSVASAKTYSVTLASPVTVGNKQLRPGDYKVKLNGSTAVFTNTETRKTLEANVKVEQANRKFNQTAVESTKTGGVDRLNAIELRGTSTKLEFNRSL
jgi:hypothetical protein